MKNWMLLAGVSLLFTAPMAYAAVEKEYDPGKPRVTTPWFGKIDAASRQADMTFIQGMRPHHAGALTMSQDYLASPNASSPVLKQLARGIMHNQTFEIGMLDSVESHIKAASDNRGMQQLATEGLAQQQRFLRAPMPVLWSGAANPAVTERDVQFAKAMIVHHEGALDMANAYLADPAADNLYLKKMCLDILVDQEQEIALMRKIISTYPGDAAAVKIDASMVHGMEGMHHGHGAHKMPDAPKKKAVKKSAPKKPEPDAGHHGHH